ncbi:hypothetical protein [Microvirga massiliensis]|uniref:hypothetical protein n=1 Tax=Microvirga massiliensis TaxID=1033741 RepID=UPI00062BD184|nr:hypothetical protein [Microvirga massiliensis]
MSLSGDSPDPVPAGPWYAAFDALRIAQPAAANRLARAFPNFDEEIRGRRKLGSGATGDVADVSVQRAELGRAAVEAVLAGVTASLDEVLVVVRKRAAALARMRLTSAIVTLLGTSGVIAAIPIKVEAAFASAAIAFISAAITLVSAYREDASGGEGSVSRLREEMMAQIGALAEVRGKLALGQLLQQDDELVAIMTSLNSIAEKVLVARGRLQMRLADPLAAS